MLSCTYSTTPHATPHATTTKGTKMIAELIALAETLNAARIAANTIEAAAPQDRVYGHTAQALNTTLELIMGTAERAVVVYQCILDGSTVTEGIDWEMTHREPEAEELGEPDTNTPTWSKNCTRCGSTVERWPGQAYPTCNHCGAEYNAGGQRLRDDWRGNASAWDDEVGDLEGYEAQHAGD